MPDINADFTERVVLHTADMPWIPSPAAGVERRMLDRVGDEVARATSIVRYAPGSAFPAHVHHGGEEFLVLDGVFQDEHGDWPAGAYVRNPPTSRHTPGSEPGCTIFVKLWQFDPDDRQSVRLDPGIIETALEEHAPGHQQTVLFSDDVEVVTLETLAGGTASRKSLDGGCEILVLAGSITEQDDSLSAGGWLRLPPGTQTTITAGQEGCRLWRKVGHLRSVRMPQTKH